MASREQLTAALQVVINVARCVATKRALAATDRDPVLNFWRLLQGNLLDIAVLDWCKLFGSDNEEHRLIHWKRVFADQDTFLEDLLAHTAISRDDWLDYWQQMKSCRDQYVAHLDFDNRNLLSYPDLNKELSSAIFYYSRLITELRLLGDMRFPNDLRVYYEQYHNQASEIARTATDSTKVFAERVG